MKQDQWDFTLRFWAFVKKFMPEAYFNLEFLGNIQSIIFEYRAYEPEDIRIEIPRYPLIYEHPAQKVLNKVQVKCPICKEPMILLESPNGILTTEEGNLIEQDFLICCFCQDEPDIVQRFIERNIEMLQLFEMNRR